MLDAIPDGAKCVAPYTDRRMCFEEVLDGFLRPDRFAGDAVYLIPSFPASQAAELYPLLQTLNKEARCKFYEGVVLKRATALYPMQSLSATRETTDWVKHRWHF